MNVYQRIQELRQHIEKNQFIAQGIGNADTPSVTPNELYEKMNIFLDMVEEDIKNIEYHFEIENLAGKVCVLDDYAFSQSQLNKDIYIFQPLDENVTAVDMESLADMLKQLIDSDQLQGNVLLLPPSISVFKAKIAKPEPIVDYD